MSKMRTVYVVYGPLEGDGPEDAIDHYCRTIADAEYIADTDSEYLNPYEGPYTIHKRQVTTERYKQIRFVKR